MDEKKKKGKKKKGNQSKQSGSTFIAEDVKQTKPDDSVSNEEVRPDNYHDAAPVQNHHSGALSNAHSQSVEVSESDMDQEKRKNLGAKFVELQEEINKLEVENNIRSQKEGSLEERIKLLQNELDSCIQKEANLEEKIDDLRSKNALTMMREGSLEERIELLQNELDSCIQKEASMQEKIDDLQCKNASMSMREANFEERVKKVEEMNHSLVFEKSSIKEAVSRLSDANEGLQRQVMELKVSRDSLAQENKQLTESMSTLESRIQHLEMVSSFYASSKIHAEDTSHLKAAEASTKPDILNEYPSEKASEIHVEPLPLAGTAENPTVRSSTSTDYASEFHTTIIESNEKIETLEKTNESFSVNGSMDQSQQIQLLGLDDSRVSEDVVSVPLDEIIHELQTTAEKVEDEPVVPLSDAPLIGAPFRLISFVARFVSGADLVDR